MPHHVDIHVGQRIRNRRWKVGMTQENLAKTIGIKYQQLQKYETGANRVSASRMWEIARTLDVSVSFFFEGLGDKKIDGTTNELADLMTNKETAILINAYQSLSVVQRIKLLDLAKAMAA